VNRKVTYYILLAVVSLFLLTLYQYSRFSDNRLHIVFCDVGQGDAILITTPSRKRILIDAGPDKAVLSCLSEHMPFWDRTIDLVILTHPHLDHFYGMYYVAESYDIKAFATEDLSNKADSFKGLMQVLSAQKIPKQFVVAGDKWVFTDGVTFSVLAPTKEFISITSPNGTVGEKAEFANLITQLTYGEFDAVFTGDSQARGLTEAIQGIGEIDVLQVPHHGSKTGLSDSILQDISPELAVVSVGEKNRYGHPTKFILDLLSGNSIKTLRTDRNGDVEIVTDGKVYSALPADN
jgi:competence protein ComEC